MKNYTTRDAMILELDGKMYSSNLEAPSIDVPFGAIADVVAGSIPKGVSINVVEKLNYRTFKDFEVEGSGKDFVTIRINQFEPQMFYDGLFNLPYYSVAKKEVVEETNELTLEYYGEEMNNHFLLTYSFKHDANETITEIKRFVESVIDKVEKKIYTKLIRLAQEESRNI